MIVSEMMTTKLVTVTPEDTLSHAANLLRQHQFHHLPVARVLHSTSKTLHPTYLQQPAVLLLEGIITTQDIELAVALDNQSHSEGSGSWQDRHVAEVMHPATITVSTTTSVAAAARLLVERGLNYLPVVAYDDAHAEEQAAEHEPAAILVGLLTRSDLLTALAHALGAFEPGIDVILPLPSGDFAPLAKTLLLAEELHIRVRSVLAAPLDATKPPVATVRLGTIHPTPLLLRLHEANIAYRLVDSPQEGDAHV